MPATSGTERTSPGWSTPVTVPVLPTVTKPVPCTVNAPGDPPMFWRITAEGLPSPSTISPVEGSRGQVTSNAAGVGGGVTDGTGASEVTVAGVVEGADGGTVLRMVVEADVVVVLGVAVVDVVAVEVAGVVDGTELGVADSGASTCS